MGSASEQAACAVTGTGSGGGNGAVVKRATRKRPERTITDPPQPAAAPDWTNLANCASTRGTPTDLFFSAPSKPPAMCAPCPVRAQCEALGRSTNSMGHWGGVWLEPTGVLDLKRARDQARFQELYTAGETDGVIARLTDVNRSTVNAWRKNAGLPPNVTKVAGMFTNRKGEPSCRSGHPLPAEIAERRAAGSTRVTPGTRYLPAAACAACSESRAG